MREPGVYLERYSKLASGSYSSVFRGIVAYEDGAERQVAIKQSLLHCDEDKIGTRWLHALRNVLVGSFADASSSSSSSRLMPMERASLRHLGGSAFLLTWLEPLGGYTLGERSSVCRRRWDGAQLSRYLSDVSDALRFLHEEVFGRGKGAHWDVKPDNVVILWNAGLGRACATLLDFGMSRSVLGTKPRTVCSLPYRPPERLYAGEYAEVGSAVDAWSLGMTALDSVTRALDNMFAPPIEMFDPVKTDLDMAISVASLLGVPDEDSWPGLMERIDADPMGREGCYWDYANDEGSSETMLVFAPLEAELRRAETFRDDPGFAKWVRGLLAYDPTRRDTSFSGPATAAATAAAAAAATAATPDDWHPPGRFILCEHSLERLDFFEWNELDRAVGCDRAVAIEDRRRVVGALLSSGPEWTLDFVGACVVFVGLPERVDISSARIVSLAMFDDAVPPRFRGVSCVRPSLELARLVGHRRVVKDWIQTTERLWNAGPPFANHLLLNCMNECLRLITPMYVQVHFLNDQNHG